MKRAFWVAFGLAVLYFAVEGGEFGTSDLVSQRSRKARLGVTIDSLQRIVDSLERYRKLVETDSATQERIAREEFGMVRGNKELLYRFSSPRGEGTSGARRP